MKEFKQRKVWKTLKYSKLAIVLYILLTVYFIMEMLNFYNKWTYLNARTKEAERNLDRVQISLDKKTKDVDFIQTERGQEDYYRKTMPVAKPDEKVIILYDAKESPIQVVPTTTNMWLDLKSKWKYFKDNYTNL